MTIKLRNTLNSISFLAFMGLPACAMAAESSWVQSEFLKVRLVTENVSAADTVVRAALEINMEPEWHIYWRMPGDGGLPPELDWDKSENLQDSRIEWPAPKRFEYEGLYGFGYKNSVALPLTFTVKEAGRELSLSLQADIMVCKELCIPQSLSLNMLVPSMPTTDPVTTSFIDKAFENLPFKEDRADIKIENVVLGPKAIVVQAYISQGFEGADLFVEAGSDLYIVAPPAITVDDKDRRRASMIIQSPEGTENLARAIMGKPLTLTLVNGEKALERTFDF